MFGACTNSSTRIRSPDSSPYTVGSRRPAVCSTAIASSLALSRSMVKSSSSRTPSRKSPARSTGCIVTPSGVRRSMSRASCITAWLSRVITSSRFGRWTFTTTSSPVVEPCPVHLGDRGARQGLPVERLEDLLGTLPEFGGDVRTHRRLRLRFRGAAQLAQFLAPRRWQYVGARRGDLAELDEDPTGLLERAANPDRELGTRCGPSRHPVAPGDGDHLPVATQWVDLAADAGHGIRDDDQPGRFTGGERADRCDEIDEDRHAHREQRAEHDGDRCHRERGPLPVGDESRRRRLAAVQPMIPETSSATHPRRAPSSRPATNMTSRPTSVPRISQARRTSMIPSMAQPRVAE